MKATPRPVEGLCYISSLLGISTEFPMQRKLKKPVIKNSLKIKIEVRFTDYLSSTASPGINKIEIKSIKAETIRHYSNVVLGAQTP